MVAQILKLKDQKMVFGIFLPTIEKIPKWTPKKKIENPSTTHTFYAGLGSKGYLGPRDPIKSMGYGGGGV